MLRPTACASLPHFLPAPAAALLPSLHATKLGVLPSLPAPQEHQLAVVDCLRSPDVTLKRKTLQLLYKMAGPSNIEARGAIGQEPGEACHCPFPAGRKVVGYPGKCQDEAAQLFTCRRLPSLYRLPTLPPSTPAQVIAGEVLGYLRESQDEVARGDAVRALCDLAERYAPDHTWFVDTMNELFEVAGGWAHRGGGGGGHHSTPHHITPSQHSAPPQHTTAGLLAEARLPCRRAHPSPFRALTLCCPPPLHPSLQARWSQPPWPTTSRACWPRGLARRTRGRTRSCGGVPSTPYLDLLDRPKLPHVLLQVRGWVVCSPSAVVVFPSPSPHEEGTCSSGCSSFGWLVGWVGGWVGGWVV